MPDWGPLANTDLALRRKGQLGGELFLGPSSIFHSLILVTPKNGPNSVVGNFSAKRGADNTSPAWPCEAFIRSDRLLLPYNPISFASSLRS